MASKYFNVTGELTQELLAAGDTVLFTKISLSNVQGTSHCTADMFIGKKLVGKFYLFKDIKLPYQFFLIDISTKSTLFTNAFFDPVQSI